MNRNSSVILIALGLVLAAAVTSVQADVFQPGTVIHKKYSGFSWLQPEMEAQPWYFDLAAPPQPLFDDPRFPDDPDRVDALAAYEYPPNGVWRDLSVDPDRQYFDTIEGCFVPPQTGDYVFFTAFADRVWIYLSTDEDPANKQTVLSVMGWSSGSRAWFTSMDYDLDLGRSDKSPYNQWSGPMSVVDGNKYISLEAGKRYYLLMAHFDPPWAGGDWFAATYKMFGEQDPGDGSEPLLTGDVIGSYQKEWEPACTTPVAICTPSTKVSNSSRYYRALTGTSDCYPCSALTFYVGDTATPAFVAGPYACEDVVRVSKATVATVKPGKYGTAAIITVRGSATVWAVDPDGRVGAVVVCP